MPGEFAPRFAIEAGFLILLGVGAGLADLRASVIVILLAGGWLLVTLIELAAWHAQARPRIPPAPPPAEPEAALAPEPADRPGETDSADDTAYPLRADAGSTPSEEVEAYTRVLGAGPEGESPEQSS
jgi:hypothetical protein